MRKFVPSSLCLFLACSLLVGCRSYFLTYPYPWDYPKENPKEADVAGSYKIRKLRLPSTVTSGIDKDARITLRTDGKAILSGIPVFNVSGEKLVCSLSCVTAWKLKNTNENGGAWSVEFQEYTPAIKAAAQECEPNNMFLDVVVVNRRAPYRLYQTIGDPDSDTGIEFERDRQ